MVCPSHFLSWFICPDDFERLDYATKEKLIIISPDVHPAKAEIVRRISECLPDHKIVEIRNMTYERYKSIIRHAKFAFTFGEGLDGYFAETIFCGGVGLAMFEDRYFTAEYRGFDGVFRDSDHAIAGVAEFLRRQTALHGTGLWRQPNIICVARTFDRKEYERNVRASTKSFARTGSPTV